MERFGDKVLCNPAVKLEKGQEYPNIQMDKISPGCKYVNTDEIICYEGQGGCKFEDHDVLMARITPCLENGKIAIADTNGKKGIGSTELFVFRGIGDVSDTDYIFYLLSMSYMRKMSANSMTGASGRQRADLGFIKRIPWTFPSVYIQKEIVSVLSQYDLAFDNNNKRIKILEQMAENLYKEWFVRFRFPGHEEAEFVAGEPKDWYIKRLDEIIQIDRGLSYSSEEIDCDAGSDLINLKNIQAYGGFRVDGTKKYSGRYKKSHVVKRGDLVMGVTDMTQDRRTVGAVALIPMIHNTSVISADLIKISSEYNKAFLYCMFKYGGVSRYISQFANGTNVLHLRPQAVKKVKLYFPTKNIIDLFSEIVQPIINEIDMLNECNNNLTRQRDLLLPRLMSGKLHVK